MKIISVKTSVIVGLLLGVVFSGYVAPRRTRDHKIARNHHSEYSNNQEEFREYKDNKTGDESDDQQYLDDENEGAQDQDEEGQIFREFSPSPRERHAFRMIGKHLNAILKFGDRLQSRSSLDDAQDFNGSSRATVPFEIPSLPKLPDISIFPLEDMDDSESEPRNGGSYTAEEFVRRRKFMPENHKFTTKDGYTLYALRVRNPLIKNPPKGPVLLITGLLTSVNLYMVNSGRVVPKNYTECPLETDKLKSADFNSIPFMLANAGYDVWLVENRGVERSNRAKQANIREKRFWDFSLDELALQDFPAAVKFVKDRTKAKTIGYLGFSQGTFFLFSALSKHPELNNIIKPGVALAPVAYFNNARGLLPFLETILQTIYRFRIFQGAFPSYNTSRIRRIATRFCRWNQFLCQRVAEAIAGDSDVEYPPVAMAYFLYPTSHRVLTHFYQLRRTTFQMFNFGPGENMLRYKQRSPPRYNVSKITNKYLAFVRGETDFLANIVDSDRLINSLKVPLMRDVRIGPKFNHFDFFYGNNVPELVNRPILEIFEKANGCGIQKKPTTVRPSVRPPTNMTIGPWSSTMWPSVKPSTNMTIGPSSSSTMRPPEVSISKKPSESTTKKPSGSSTKKPTGSTTKKPPQTTTRKPPIKPTTKPTNTPPTTTESPEDEEGRSGLNNSIRKIPHNMLKPSYVQVSATDVDGIKKIEKELVRNRGADKADKRRQKQEPERDIDSDDDDQSD